MKWVLFAMYITSTGTVDNWQKPTPYATEEKCSEALIEVVDNLYQDHPEIYAHRVLICDEVADGDIEAANMHFFKEFHEGKPF